MKTPILMAVAVFAAGSILAADPKDEVTAAAKKLADSNNYSWSQTTENAGGGGFGGGPQTGQYQDGLIHTVVDFNGNTFETLRKGTNGATKGMDGAWQTYAEAAAAAAANADPNAPPGGRRGFRGGRGGFGGNQPAPATAASDIVGQVKSLSLSGGAFVGDLTDDGAKAQMTFGGGRGRRGGAGGAGAPPPDISGAKGSVKFWVTDGVLTKYELKVQGKISFNGNDIDVDRTTTVEFKDVGKTKINVPEDIVKKIS